MLVLCARDTSLGLVLPKCCLPRGLSTSLSLSLPVSQFLLSVLRVPHLGQVPLFCPVDSLPFFFESL